jgi:hypothetical protein
LRRGGHGAILLSGREIAVQREKQALMGTGETFTSAGSAADLRSSRKEYEDVSRVVFGE